MTWRFPVSLKVTVPLILLGFAATLSAVNVLYHVPKAQHAEEEDGRKRLAQEVSRLQSTIEYLLLKGDDAVAHHEIAVLAHNHDVVVAALTDDEGKVIASTRRAWIGRPIAEAIPHYDLARAQDAIRQRRAGIDVSDDGQELLGYAGILMTGPGDEIRPSRTGSLFLAYDLAHYKAEARAQVIEQSVYWAGWVTALALAMWLVFHFLLTRRTARLVHAAEEIAAGNLSARSGLTAGDELGRLGRAFDAMALEVAETQTRLRQDIHERVRVQRELEASEEQYRAMFNASIDGLALWDEAGGIVETNPALRRMFGYEESEFAALPAQRWAGLSQHPDFLRMVMAGTPLRIELAETRKDGAQIDIEVHGVPMQYRGKPHVLTITRDVTSSRQAASELTRQRERSYQREKLAALGSLLAGVSHELNNPLSVVVARAVLLEEQGDAATQAAAAKIRTAAERCARIVRTFLAMARQQPPQRGPVAVNEVITAALDITAYALRTSSIDIELDLAQGIPHVLADADQLHQVFLNLVINAQQSLQEHALPRRIRVTSRYEPASLAVRVVVADNGPGIAPQIRARIFEPYFTTKAQGVGTGVGLAVSLGIVEAHGGSIGVDCPARGGAEFTVTLPAGTAQSTAAEETAAAGSYACSHSILVVDDEADIRETLSEILRGAGHRVMTANSGREALARLSTGHYDVILSDIRMPDLDGRALYGEIEKRWPGRTRRVVFITGDTLAAGLGEFLGECGRPVIEKPFLPAEVRRIVADLVAEREPPGSGIQGRAGTETNDTKAPRR